MKDLKELGEDGELVLIIFYTISRCFIKQAILLNIKIINTKNNRNN